MRIHLDAKRAAALTVVISLGMAAGIGFMSAEASAADCSGSASCPYRDVSILGSTPHVGHGVFRFPQAITFSPGGSYVFVADQYSATVQKFDRQGTWQAQLGWYANRGQLGRFGVIGGLATDRNNHVYVLDSENDRVQVFRSDTSAWLGAWGRSGSAPGYFSLGANTGAGGIALHQPSASDPPVVYIADQYNHRLQKFTLSQFAGGDSLGPVLPRGSRAGAEPDYVPAPIPDRVWGSYGDCTARLCADPGDRYLLNYPQGVAVNSHPDESGRNDVYVADDDNHRVVEYAPDGTYLRQVGRYGSGAAEFRFPYDVGVDSHNFLYVADNNNHRVQKFGALDLSFLELWGGFGPTPGNLEFPRALSALADDPLGGVYVADTANNRVQGFDESGNQTASWGIAGRGPGYVTRPWGVAVDPAGNVYVADTWAHRIEKLAPDGSYLGQWGYISARSGFAAPADGNGQFRDPHGVAFDPKSGNVWIADTGNNRVQELTVSGSWVATFGGPSAGAGPGQFNGPQGMAVDPEGNLYVADTLNNRIQKRDAATGAWASVTFGGAVLDRPAGIAADGSGNLYVTDASRLLKIASGRASVVAPPSGTFKQPAGVWVDGAKLYVSDTGNGRVLRRDMSTGAWETVGGEGLDLGSFLEPASLVTACSGETLYVADQFNNRVQKFLLGNNNQSCSSPSTEPVTSPTSPVPPEARLSTSLPLPDTLAPKLSVRVRLRQRALRRRQLIVPVNCSERCFITARGKVKIARRTSKTGTARRTLAAGERARVRLPLRARLRRAIRRALARRKRVVARVTVKARDASGNSRSLTRRILVVR